MKAKRVGLVAALLRECGGVLAWPGWKELSSRKEKRVFELQTEGRKIILVVGGMGQKRAISSTRFLLEEFHPEVVLSIGFCGALDRSLKAAEVVKAKELLSWKGPGRLAPGPNIEDEGLPLVLKEVTIVSCLELASKKILSQELKGSSFPCTVDLESSFVAEEVKKEKVGFLAIKAISDEMELDPAPRVSKWLDPELQIRLHKVLWSFLTNPFDLLEAWRLFVRSRAASVNLGEALKRLLFQKDENPG